MNMTAVAELRRRLHELGFDAVRFVSVSDQTIGHGLRPWLANEFHADMHWMERTVEKRSQPAAVLSGVRTMIMLGVNYWPGQNVERVMDTGAQPRWARYALHADYHDTMKPALVAAGKLLEEFYAITGEDYRYYVDTGPVQERVWAERAGLGFTGKNAMLISPDFGNWLFLATILTRVEIAPDQPLSPNTPRPEDRDVRTGLWCGKCTRCIDACPTGAIVEPGVVDARRCISYQTIENKGVVPRELRAGIGTRIYGCDICAEVCPWNRFAQESRRVLLTTRYDLAELSLRQVLELTPESFAEIFRKTAIKRVKLAGLLRNACIVAGNTRAQDCRDVVFRLCTHASPLVRAHAVWALYRIDGYEVATRALTEARTVEPDASVLEEYSAEDALAR
jgi:Uncharacterized Fe-S protein